MEAIIIALTESYVTSYTYPGMNRELRNPYECLLIVETNFIFRNLIKLCGAKFTSHRAKYKLKKTYFFLKTQRIDKSY